MMTDIFCDYCDEILIFEKCLECEKLKTEDEEDEDEQSIFLNLLVGDCDIY